MAAREEIVKELARVFVVQEERYDTHNYEYWADLSIWEDHLQAFNYVETHGAGEFHRWRIILRSIDVLSSGRIYNRQVKVIFENEEWVSPEHDPRAADPRFREYLKLKKEFEG